MSAGCQLFFNTIDGSMIKESRTQDVDLFLEHDYEDDEGTVFSNYEHELSVYKLNDAYLDRIVIDFISTWKSVLNNVDFEYKPMLVYDIQFPIGYVDAQNGIKLLDGLPDVITEYKTLKAIIDEL